MQWGRKVGGRSSSSAASRMSWRGSYISRVACDASSRASGSSCRLETLVREETLRARMERSVPVVADAERDGSGEWTEGWRGTSVTWESTEKSGSVSGGDRVF